MLVRTLPVTFDIQVSKDDIDDIMVGALEGGIFYWCLRAKVDGDYLGEYASEQISNGGTLILHDYIENVDYKLTLDLLLKGLQMWLQTVRGKRAIISKDGILCIDCGNIDGPACDSIIQYALFNDIIYA